MAFIQQTVVAWVAMEGAGLFSVFSGPAIDDEFVDMESPGFP